MLEYSTETRLAILLSTMGEDVLHAALSELPSEKTKVIRSEVEKLKLTPPSNSEIEKTLDEFETFLGFAIETLKSTTKPSNVSQLADGNSGTANRAHNKTTLKLFEPSEDPIYDLKRLDPRQLAAALSNERPKTISLVLSTLDKSAAATTIDLLPENIQTETFMLLKSSDLPSEELINRVVAKVVEKAARTEPVNREEPDADQKLAQLLRELPKKTRMRLVDEIQEKDESTALRLRDLLYVFEDIKLYESRSVQKILSSIETPTLVAALQTADESIHQVIFENLSKRAVLSLKEELSFAPKLNEEEITVAQSLIAKSIGELDSNGEITLK